VRNTNIYLVFIHLNDATHPNISPETSLVYVPSIVSYPLAPHRKGIL